MVKTTIKSPVYDLGKIKDAAKRSDGLAITPRARQDGENLGYDEAALRSVICQLEPRDFDHVWICKNQKGEIVLDAYGEEIAMDVYYPWIRAMNGDDCRVYLKIKLQETSITVTSIQSFHLKRK